MDQYISFTKTKLFPAYEKNIPGLKRYKTKAQGLDNYTTLKLGPILTVVNLDFLVIAGEEDWAE